jgi:hypothetical protein
MRPNPDVMDNMFGALYYFAVPKSFLDRNLTMFLLIKDELEPSASSMPNQAIGFTTKTQDGRFKLSELLSKILFEIGHPKQRIPITLSNEKGVKAVGGKSAQIDLEVGCHPQELFMDPSMPDVNDKGPTSVTLEKMVEAGPENLDDREKWHLLTRELVQK